MTPPAAARAAAAAARVTLVLGANDTGKSTLVAHLAATLAADHTVAVVDADLGQSDVGPPTTVGLGRVARPGAPLDAAELLGLEFLGVTSPATCVRETAEATARQVTRALDCGCDRVLVNTSGLVDGDLGLSLKRLKLERVRPDLVIALQRTDECEAILRAAPVPRVLRLPAAPTTPRTPVVRRQARLRTLARHLAGAVPVTLDLTRVALRPAPGRRDLSMLDLEGTLVALDDGEGRTRGLGWVRALDRVAARLTVETAVPGETIAAVVIGSERRLDTPRASHYQCGVIRAEAKEMRA